MTRSTSSNIFFTLIVSVVLACTPNSAFAQRGGHGGGGGFHGGGGGGFHGGGGSSHGGGGGGHYAYGGGSRGGASAAPRMGGGSYARPGGYASRSYGNSAYRGGYWAGSRGPRGMSGSRPGTFSASSGRVGSSAMARNFGHVAPAKADGQWHSFAARGSTAGTAMPRNFANAGAPRSLARSSGNAVPTWHSFGNAASVSRASAHAPVLNASSNRLSIGGSGGIRSIPTSSFGRSMTTNAPRAMASATFPRALPNSGRFRFDNFALGNSAFAHSAFANSRFGNISLGSSALTNSRFRSVSLFPGSRLSRPFGLRPGTTFSRGTFLGSRAFPFGPRAFESRFGFFGFPRRGFGCFGCGFDWGFGLGFGWGFGGWWGPWWGPGWTWGGWWDPYWYDPWWAWPAPPYGYSYPPPADYNVYYGDDRSPSSDAPSSDQPSTANPPSADQNAPASQGTPNTNPLTGNVAESTPTVLLYLKDGTMYAASDYWLVDNKLHYFVNYGGESTVDMDQVDLQRTVDENSKRGVRFSLKPKPNRSSPASSTDRTPPSAATSGNPTTNHNNRNDAAPPTTPTLAPPQIQSTSQTRALSES